MTAKKFKYFQGFPGLVRALCDVTGQNYFLVVTNPVLKNFIGKCIFLQFDILVPNYLVQEIAHF